MEESARRKGIAASLISCLEENLKSRGVEEIKILTGIQNTIAIATYEHGNYVKADEVLLQKQLN